MGSGIVGSFPAAVVTEEATLMLTLTRRGRSPGVLPVGGGRSHSLLFRKSAPGFSGRNLSEREDFRNLD